MCWTLEDYMMINALFKGLYEEWSCVELSILQACLEGFKTSSLCREDYEVQVQEKHLEEILCLKLVTLLEILVK